MQHDSYDDQNWSRNDRRTTARRGPFLSRHGGKMMAALVLAVVAVGAVVYNATRPEDQSPDIVEAPPASDAVEDGAGVDLTQPFAGTPAEAWPDGVTGIVAPPPVAVGEFSAEEVGQAYAKVRQVLIASRLDREVIEGHDYERFLKLLAPKARADLRPGFSDDLGTSYSYATRIADDFRLLPVDPKVQGTMSAELGKDGSLVIHTNYVFAYAFDTLTPERVTDAMDIVAVDRWEADYVLTDDRWPEDNQGLWLDKVQGYGYSIACTAYKEGSLAPAYSERIDGDDADPEAEDRYFDPSKPLLTDSSCPA
ncbi:MAG: hypothetical protein GEV28_39240 [Actinophytocola sp.]|uniref:hypothetical protein n=1 Tax=Actinophytocola sp. TaxID=1872138 RepID=UPI00132B7EE4|nr:hypothetical protein [Actinophytocola sp.]MPZ86087.1 hypothetical protein [Actinophytocola sp.]